MVRGLRRKGLGLLLAGLLTCAGIGVPAIQAAPAKSEDHLVETTIPHTQQKGEGHQDGNYFTYSPDAGWSIGQGGTEEHYWSKDPANAEQAKKDLWYEVTFDGSAIDIYSGKNRMMGKVKYTVDAGTAKEKSIEGDLYNSGNQTCEFIGTIDGLDEGLHTLRAQATGTKNDKSTGYTMDCAKVVVKHGPYVPSKLAAAEGSEKVEVAEMGEKTIQLDLAPDYVSSDDLTFTSKDSKIAKVDVNGTVTGKTEGETTIVVAPKATAAKDGVKPLEIPVTVAFAAPKMGGFISDVDTQWTQDRFNEAKERIESAKKAEDKTAVGKLSAWKNDAAISEITLAALEGAPLSEVSVKAGDFTGDAGTIGADNVELSFIGSTKAYTGWLGYGNQPSRYPADNGQNRKESNDVLLGDAPVDVKPDSLQNVFVKVKVPKGAKAGVYTGKIEAAAKGMETPLTFTYELTVKDAELPDASEFEKSFDIELWQYPYSSAEYYGVEPFSAEHFEILKPIMAMYKDLGGHAITTTITEEAWQGQTYADDSSAGHNEKIHYPSMVRWEKGTDGVMRYDFTNFDKWVEFNKEQGIGDKIILYSIAPWIQNKGERFHNQAIKYWENGELKTVDSSTVGTAVGNGYWRHFLRAMVDHLEAKGWFDDAYVGIDERGFSHEAFDMVDSVKNSKGQSLKTAGAMDHIENVALAMRVDDLNIGDYIPDTKSKEFKTLLEKRNDAGLRTTLYSCTEHAPGNFSLSSPVESYWSMVNAGKQGTSGFLRWAYDAWVDDPLNDATHWSFEPGDCFFIYPGADKATVEASKGSLTAEMKTARSSVRLERMAQGVRDVNKINLMTGQVSELEDDARELYTKVGTKGYYDAGHKYLSAENVKKLAGEMREFDKGLDALTDSYIAKRGKAPTSVTIKGGDTVKVGETLSLTVETDAPAKGVKWSSSNPDIATVSAKGVVSGKKPGVADITATSKSNGKASGTVRITVTAAKAPEAPVDEAAKVAHYAFEGDAKNDWGKKDGALDGTVGEGVTFAEDGKMGKAAVVDGTANKSITIDSNKFSLDGAKSWTVAFWAKPTAGMNGKTIAVKDNDTHYGVALRVDNPDKPGFAVDTGKWDKLTFSKAPTLKTGEWNRIALVQDPAKGATLYINGKQADKTDWTVGKKNEIKLPVGIIGAEGFTGFIDELAVYNKALSAEQVASQYGKFSDGQSGIDPVQKTIYEGESFGISGNFDKDVSFSVKSAKNVADDKGDVVQVSKDGRVDGLQRGTAVVEVKQGDHVETVAVEVKRHVTAANMLNPILIDQDRYTSDIYDPRTAGDGNWEQNRRYYGQPDMIRTETGRLITAFPNGHGHGPILMRYSDDEGATWKEFEKPLPKDWENSRETPTLYALRLADGHERLMMITACPNWGDGNSARGWNTSYSDDNGETWSDYKNWWPTMEEDGKGGENPAVVGMASLIQLRDKDGKPEQRWMGVYHHQGGKFTNYKTYLTFDEKGNEHWSKPELLLPESRDIEAAYQMCEIGMFRSPDGKRIVGLCRSQSHNNPSTLIYSDDEGRTWSKPMDLPGSLAGERHKAMYDPVSGRLVITFREIEFDINHNDKFDGNNDWTCGDWGMWVGTYDQLMNQQEGDFRFVLAEDWSKSAKSGDCGYTGLTVNPETGLFVMDSYGHWDKKFTEDNKFDVRQDLSYIKQAKFTLDDLLRHHGLIDDQRPVNAKVTFDFNFDGAPAVEVKTVPAGTALDGVAPAAPAREGYEFTGWCLDAVGEQAYDLSAPVDSNLTLYASWRKVEAGGPVDPEGPVNPDGQGGDQHPSDQVKPGDSVKPDGGSKPSSGLPQTGDDALVAVGGVCVVAVALVVVGAILRKRGGK